MEGFRGLGLKDIREGREISNRKTTDIECAVVEFKRERRLVVEFFNYDVLLDGINGLIKAVEIFTSGHRP
jgi:hypothetical protein